MPTSSLPRLRLFVYGTLKPGFDNHNRYCRGVRSMEEAQIEGRLFQMPTGYPVLRLPVGRILARASGDLAADIEMQQQLAEDMAHRSESRPFCRTASRVHGTLLTFANPVERLRAMDDLEGFRPSHRNRYERVLIPVYSRISLSATPVWTYMAGDLSPRGRLISTGRWTPAVASREKGNA